MKKLAKLSLNYHQTSSSTHIISSSLSSGWEKFIGAILALGTAGIVGVCGTVLFGCILIGCIICAVTCCRKACRKYCKVISKPFANTRKSRGKKLSENEERAEEKHEETHDEEKELTGGEIEKTDNKTESTSPPPTVILVSSAEKTVEIVKPSGDLIETTGKRDASVTPGGRDDKLKSSGLLSAEEANDVTKIDT